MAQEIEGTSFKKSQTIYENAKELRKNLTDAERKLWSKLRTRMLANLKFQRQHPIDKFVADFYCAEHRVVVEIDGGIHLSTEQREYDQTRTEILAEKGIRVIRFTNEEVLLDLNKTLTRIVEFTSPRPSPRNGEGGMPKVGRVRGKNLDFDDDFHIFQHLPMLKLCLHHYPLFN